MKHSSPSTDAVVAAGAAAQVAGPADRPRRGAARPRRGRRCRGRRRARGRRRRAPGRCRRAPCSRRCGRRPRPGSRGPITAEPSILASGWTSAPSPSQTPVAQLEAGHVDLDLAVEHVLVGRHVGLERADVLPVALGDRAEQRPARRRGASGTPRWRSRPAGRARCSRRSRARARRCPVLMVSLNTWPHVGFSRKRSMVPSSLVMTMPNSSGFSTADQPDGGQRLVLVVEVDDLGRGRCR